MTDRIRKLSKNDKASLTILIDSCFNISAKDSESIIDWKYYQGDEVISRAITNKKGSIVSFYCNKRIDIVKDGRRYKAGLCLDMATDVNYRGRGFISDLSKKVYKEVRSKNYDLSFGFSNKQGVKVDKFSKNYGYQIVGVFGQFYKPVLRKKDTMYRLEKASVFEKIIPFENVYQLDASPDYLNWRFKQFPEERYQIKNVLKNNKKICQLVIRKKSKKLEVLKILNIHEVDLYELLKTINNLAYEYNSHIIVISLLEDSILEKTLKRSRFLKLPNKKKYYFTVKIHSKRINEKEILDPSKWLIMGGDIL